MLHDWYVRDSTGRHSFCGPVNGLDLVFGQRLDPFIKGVSSLVVRQSGFLVLAVLMEWPPFCLWFSRIASRVSASTAPINTCNRLCDWPPFCNFVIPVGLWATSSTYINQPMSHPFPPSSLSCSASHHTSSRSLNTPLSSTSYLDGTPAPPSN